MIKEDLEAEIAAAVKEEEEAQAEFEESKAASEALLNELAVKSTELEEAIAGENREVNTQNKERADQDKQLKEEQDYLWSIKPDCEYIYKAFDTRREKRAQEIDGLLQSKAMLMGAEEEQPAATLLQKKEGFSDDDFSKLHFLGLGAR